MIRSAAIAVWVVLVTAAVTYFTFNSKVAAVMPKPEGPGREWLLQIEAMAVPVMRASVMRGYLLLDLGIASQKEVAGEYKDLLEIAVRNAAIRTIYANNSLDIFQLDKLDVEAVQTAILDAVKRDEVVDSTQISKIYLKNVNFLPIESLRQRE